VPIAVNQTKYSFEMRRVRFYFRLPWWAWIVVAPIWLSGVIIWFLVKAIILVSIELRRRYLERRATPAISKSRTPSLHAPRSLDDRSLERGPWQEWFHNRPR
jgi:hypothetical protein